MNSRQERESLKSLSQRSRYTSCYNGNTEVFIVEKKDIHQQAVILGDEFRFLLNEDDAIYDETFGHLLESDERASRANLSDEGSVQ